MSTRDERSGPPRHYLTFLLGGRRRGLDSRRVVRVAEVYHLAPLPSDLRCNLGLVVHRQVVMGLMDLQLAEAREESSAVRPPTPKTLPALCVFARFPGGIAGFPVDRLLGLETLSSGNESFEPVDLDRLDIFV